MGAELTVPKSEAEVEIEMSKSSKQASKLPLPSRNQEPEPEPGTGAIATETASERCCDANAAAAAVLTLRSLWREVLPSCFAVCQRLLLLDLDLDWTGLLDCWTAGLLDMVTLVFTLCHELTTPPSPSSFLPSFLPSLLFS